MAASLEDGRMGPDDLDDTAELVKRATAGEREAWNELVRRFSGLIWAIVRQHRLGGEDAHDVTQVVWLKLLESLGSLREPSRVGGWLVTTTKRESLRVIRLRRRTVPAADEPLETQADPSALPDELVAERDYQRAVFAVVRKLGLRCRQLLELSAFKLPYQEIAELLNMPVGSIGPTRMRCLNQLRELLRAAGINPDVADS
jgi:RNA polymerase sigma factor (sigma-70 family)